MPKMSSAARHGLVLAALTVALDQASKWLILTMVMVPPREIPVTSFFSLVLYWNRGISFGMFGDAGSWGPWILSGLAAVIAIVLLVWLWGVDKRWTALSLGLIVGGAVGNLIDRLVHGGAVADFILLHAGGYAWPAFNVADSAITVGAVALVAESLFGKADRNRNDDSGESS